MLRPPPMGVKISFSTSSCRSRVAVALDKSKEFSLYGREIILKCWPPVLLPVILHEPNTHPIRLIIKAFYEPNFVQSAGLSLNPNPLSFQSLCLKLSVLKTTRPESTRRRCVPPRCMFSLEGRNSLRPPRLATVSPSRRNYK